MFGTRTIAMSLACAAALSLGGCTREQQEGLKAEFVRDTYHSPVGAQCVVGVVGSAAPSGGPSALHAVGMDLAWRSLMARNFEMSGQAPSPFDTIDPNRPVQFRKIDETTTEIIIR